jgi:hypothetical protein
MGLFDYFRGGKPSKDAFAKTVAAALREAGETTGLRYEPESFRLVTEGEEEHILNLGNAYDEYCATSANDRQQVIRRFVRSWFSRHKELPSSLEDVGPDLLPAVRSRSYFELMTLELKAQAMPSPDLPLQVLGEHFAVCLVYDLPEAMRQIQHSDLSDWRIGFEEALDVAKANLAEISAEDFEPIAAGVWRSPWRDNHDASRVLLDDVIGRHDVTGDPVVMIPNRDTLLLTGAEDPAGLRDMAALAEQALHDPRPMSGVALRFADGTWTPFVPRPGHPAHEKILLLNVQSIGQDYHEQKELLDKLHEKSGDDLFVASFSAMQENETGLIRSYCVWSEGVDALLPRTDLVHFFVARGDDGSIVASAGWDRVQEVLGDLMEPQGAYPERYRVRTFPTQKQIEALGLD